ncbi:NAD-dependent epimerase/dehydratase family protein [Clostridium vincentii]|uniref:UDP-galactose-4-epimerase n=1 Tax=Clostridium vincentii TaxID=52704 RepID=A0A2T0BCZ5_9CLOT|nr:NAD-dependent epimerase/dehydratase family protein [Clostridium vincentii]PRR81769.1 UDP-galactose-4-epimerase [Clostridium vincentii]
MKRILITGANSYIGTSFERWVEQWPDKYSVDTVDMKDGSWKEKDFSEYDVVFHVAGIAHIKETPENKDLYYKVNCDLAVEVAKAFKVVTEETKSKRHFIFLSSMSVYGINTGVITKAKQPSPISNYGKSKLQAEGLIKELESENFIISILRPPMVYGNGCKGNYVALSKLAKNLPVFPEFENQRSMIHIDNLNEFVRLLLEDGTSGLFFPQNKEYVKTSEMVKAIAMANNKTSHTTRIFNPLLKLACKNVGIVKKAFGSLIYEHDMSGNYEYCVCEFEESILKTEK